MFELDAINLEIAWTRLTSLVDEAAAALVRTAFSTIVRECNDYAVVLTDRQGNLLAQSSQSIPSFICTLPLTVRHFIERFDGRIEEGDVFVTNDPWLGTGHLPDFNIVVPVFRNGEIIAFAASAAHVPDIGGRLRSPSNREVFEEGLRVLPTKLLVKGKVNEQLEDILRANVRVPDEVMGDLWAQIGCDRMLSGKLIGFLDETGLDLEELSRVIQQRSDEAMRQAISRVPDGTYEARTTVEGGEDTITIVCSLTVSGDTITVDYTGSSKQLPVAINVVPSYTFAYSAYILKCLLSPDVPNNEGSFRAISVSAPKGSILNTEFPAPVGARAMTGHLLPPVIMSALAKAMPEQVQAAPGSPVWSAQFSGHVDGQPFATSIFINGGQGASRGRNGLCTLSFPSNLANTPIEILEARVPLRVLSKSLRKGSGGDGHWRGGEGQAIEIEVLGENPVAVSFMANRISYPAEGILGGGEGGCGIIELNGQPIDPKVIHYLEPGSLLTLATPGGGGYGSTEGTEVQHDDR